MLEIHHSQKQQYYKRILEGKSNGQIVVAAQQAVCDIGGPPQAAMQIELDIDAGSCVSPAIIDAAGVAAAADAGAHPERLALDQASSE